MRRGEGGGGAEGVGGLANEKLWQRTKGKETRETSDGNCHAPEAAGTAPYQPPKMGSFLIIDHVKQRREPHKARAPQHTGRGRRRLYQTEGLATFLGSVKGVSRGVPTYLYQGRVNHAFEI
jgi:hypothetical protein